MTKLGKKARFHSNQLTAKDKLEILLRTKDVLGRGGKNWIHGTWYGKRPADNDPSWDMEVSFVNFYDDADDRAKADCFCLEGAVYFAAYKLRYTTTLPEDDLAAHRVSLAGLIEAKDGCSVNELNDHNEWKTIKNRLELRIKQVLREVKTEAA